MARMRTKWTPELIKKRIAEGRGQGEGQDYIPWLLIQDFPSRGRVHRIFGWKTGRIHHLLSDLERNVFFHFQWPHSVKDLREQYPLPLEETIEIAKEIGVRHPTDPSTRYPVVMSTDLLLTIEQGVKFTFHPRTVKYLKDLQNSRTREKLEIERRCWAAAPRNSKLKIVTEQQISEPFIKNILWSYPYYWLVDLHPLTEKDVNKIAALLTHMLLNESLPLRAIARRCDRILRLETGTSLAVTRHLLANRFWEVDMTNLIRTNERLALLNSPQQTLYCERRLVA